MGRMADFGSFDPSKRACSWVKRTVLRKKCSSSSMVLLGNRSALLHLAGPAALGLGTGSRSPVNARGVPRHVLHPSLRMAASAHAPAVAEREKNLVAVSSVGAAVLLTSMKLIVGLATGSIGILSEAAHSGIDL